MSSQPIRVGIIGAGANTRAKHIPGLRAIEGVEIVSVRNSTDASSQQTAEELQIARWHSTWRELIEADDIDAVVIGTWPYMHCRCSVAALEAGKHVMCEARMARSAAEARRMLEAAQMRPHLVAQVVPSPFTLEVDATIKRFIAEGALGEIVSVEAVDRRGFPDQPPEYHWRNDFELSGFNTMSLGIWYEAIMRWLGVATSVQASGRIIRPLLQRDGDAYVTRVYDHLEVLAEMACGAQLRMSLSSVTGPPEQYVAVHGTEASIRYDGNTLMRCEAGEDEFTPMDVPEDERGGWRVEEEFVGAIRGEEQIELTRFEDGLRYMEFVEATVRAAQSGETVQLPLPE
ncbi:MAG: Gfo/Idh/MocA family protein [Armatimonadota bacterium]